MKLVINGKNEWHKPEAFFCPKGNIEEAVEIDFGPANDAVSAFAVQAVDTKGVIEGRDQVKASFGKGAKNDLFLIRHGGIDTHSITRGNLLSILENADTVYNLLNVWTFPTDEDLEIGETDAESAGKLYAMQEHFPSEFRGKTVNQVIEDLKEASAKLVTEYELPEEVKPKVTRSASKARTW